MDKLIMVLYRQLLIMLNVVTEMPLCLGKLWALVMTHFKLIFSELLENVCYSSHEKHLHLYMLLL